MEKRVGRYRYVVENLAPAGAGGGDGGGAGGAGPGGSAGAAATGGGPAREVRLWLALPIDHPGQRAELVRVEPEPLEIVEDPFGGNRIAVWRARPGPETTALAFTVDFEVEGEEVRTDVDPARVEPYDRESEAYRRHVQDEPWLERTAEIEDLARRLAGEETNPWLVARRFFDWVRTAMTYVYPDATERGAAKALARKSGDCGEYVNVFLALCRARGIPGRAVTGCWFTGSGHQWAEILVPPHGWVPVDPSMAQVVATRAPVFGGPEATGRFLEGIGLESADPAWLFGNLYPRRLIVFVGTNVEVRTEAPDLRRTFAFLQPGGGNGWPPAIEWEGVGDRPVHGGFFLFDGAARDEEAARRAAAKTLAVSWLHAGDLSRADEGLRLGLEEAPDSAFHWFYLGQVRQQRGEFALAREAYGKSLGGRWGSLKHVIDAWGRVFLGMCFDAEGRRVDALREYDLALASGVDVQGSLALARRFRDTPYVP